MSPVDRRFEAEQTFVLQLDGKHQNENRTIAVRFIFSSLFYYSIFYVHFCGLLGANNLKCVRIYCLHSGFEEFNVKSF